MKLSELPKTKNVQTLPYCLKVLLENLIRNQDGVDITQEHIDKLSNWQPNSNEQFEIQFTPARVIMQDFTGVPCVVDLATMREAAKDLGIDPEKINPLKQTNLIIDHSVQIDYAGSGDAFEKNLDLDYQRNSERYQFLKWGANSLDNFKVVPPAKGIIHQINLEKIADVVREDSNSGVFFDSCVGTDSHTTMENSLGILGWGVGGIEAEAALLGQPISMLVPEVVGFEITGEPKDFVTTTDIVLTIVEMLRKLGVVGKFVEFYGSGVKNLQLADRATISNMCPEFGATCAIFAIDQQTIDYLRLTGRSEEHLKQIEEYAKIQNCWGDSSTWSEPARYSETLSLNLSTVVSSISGPKRPQDRINLVDMNLEFKNSRDNSKNIEDVHDNDVVIASITSCTNTSNPAVLIGAGLLAKKAVQKGLNSKPWVKTSLAPGSRVVPAYLDKASLTQDLDKLGFQLVGFGCATCIGNSGPLAESVHNQIQEQDLSVAAVLSGNRNFEGRISPDVKLNFLASPPLVIAYAIAGRIDFDFENTPLGQDKNGQDVFLKDIWPSRQEIQAVQNNVLSSELFNQEYQDIFEGDSRWQNLKVETGETYEWDLRSTYVRKAPYFDNMSREISDVKDIKDAYVLAWLGDSVTTDHISPAGSIKEDSPAGKYLQNQGVSVRDFNSYGSRRGNHEVMVRGTFANIRLNNKLVSKFTGSEKQGGWTVCLCGEKPKNKPITIFDASECYKNKNIPLIVIAGKEYGTGSSRDWAAKGTLLLGVKAVFAESFERIHRSNLIGMGVLPLQFKDGETSENLGLKGDESFDIIGIEELNNGKIPEFVHVVANSKDGNKIEFDMKVRIDTEGEANYFRNGGILQYVLRSLL